MAELADKKRENSFIEYTPLNLLTESFEVGDLYDAKKRQFLHAGKLFHTPAKWVPQDVAEYDYLVDNNVSNRIDKLDVTANMKASFLAGAVEVTGSAKYLDSDREDAASHTMHVIYKGKKGTMELDTNVYQLPPKDLRVKNACATHVISKIIMGYNVATTLSISKESGTEEKNVAGSLEIAVKAIAAAGAGDVDLSTFSDHMKKNVSVRISGDFELTGLPQTLEKVADFTNNLPKLVKDCNGAKGVPKKVFLVPLTLFTGLPNPEHAPVHSIKNYTLNSMSTLMVELEELAMMCEELKILNKIKKLEKDSPQRCWSAQTQEHLQNFGREVKSNHISIQDRLRPALEKLYADNDEGDVVKILHDSLEEKEGACYVLRTKGARWLSYVREHIEHLQAISQRIKRLDENLVQSRWASPSSEQALDTELLNCNYPTVVLKVQENFSGARAFSKKDTPADPNDSKPYKNTALKDLINYAEAHAKTQGGTKLTILAYDGHGFHDHDSGSTAQIVDKETGKQVDLPPPPTPEAPVPGSAKDDRLALLEVRLMMGGRNWHRNSSWQGSDVRQWGGITVSNEYRVTTLDLHDNNVASDSFVPVLCTLRALTKLDLSLNEGLRGSIPWKIDQLDRLVVLCLRGCKLSGEIPHSLDGKMKSLVEMDLSDNQLEGSIPQCLGQITTLQKLLLTDNRLTGNIPVVLGQLRKLLTLALGKNELGGRIPPELGELVELQYLGLQFNKLEGTIPEQISDLKAMEELDLSHNRLRGTFPDLRRMTALKKLWINNNTDIGGEISSTLPSWLRLLPLDTLGFRASNLKGAASPNDTKMVGGTGEKTRTRTLNAGVIITRIRAKSGHKAISGIQITTSDGQHYTYGRLDEEYAGTRPEHTISFGARGELVRRLFLWPDKTNDRLAGIKLETTHGNIFQPTSGKWKEKGERVFIPSGFGVITGWTVRFGSEINAFGVSFAT